MERLTGEKRERAFMCKRLCCMDIIYVVIVTFLFVLIGTLLPMKTILS